MKKVWIIIAGLIIVLGAGVFLLWKFWPVNYETIRYGKGSYKASYRLSSGSDFLGLTQKQVEEKFFHPIIFSGDKYGGREIWIGDFRGTKYENAGDTIIYLKQKNADLFDVYSLQGGP